MTQFSGFRPTFAPVQLARRQRPTALSYAAPPLALPESTESAFPTFLGFLTASYLLAVCTMSMATKETSWIPQVVGLLLGLCWVVVGLFIKGQPIRWTWAMTLFVLYSVWSATGILVTIDPDFFLLMYTTQLKVCLITWVCFQCVKTRRDLLLCCVFLGVAGCIVLVQGLDSILRSLEFTGTRLTKDARAEGATLISNANTLGEFGVLVIFGSIAGLLSYKNLIFRIFSASLGITGFYIVAASGSRTAMLGVGMLGLALYWFHFRKAENAGLGRRIVLIFLAICVIAGTVLFIAKLPFFFRLQEVFSSSENLLKEPRVQYFFTSLQVTAEHPILGLGVGGFALARLGTDNKGGGHYSHSSISEALCATGVPGFLLYFGAYFVMYRLLQQTRKLRLPKYDKAMVNMLMALFWVLMIFNAVAVIQTSRFIWPFTGAALGYIWNLRQLYSEYEPEFAAA